MLKRILDTTKIDMNDEYIQKELGKDLQRMDKLPHNKKAPEGANAYKVTVEPSTQTYMPCFHRFRFYIQYGKLKNDEFIPLDKPIRTQSEALPLD